MAGFRMERINSELQKAIADIIANKLRNPELEGIIISITDVDTAADLSYAKVLVSVLGDSYTKDIVLTVLNNAKSFIRKELMHMVRLRTMPNLEFSLDESYEKGQKIIKLIDQISGDEDGK